MLNILAEREFPADEVVALASSRSVGKEVGLGARATLKVQALEDATFEGIDIALFSAGGELARKMLPRAVKAGAVAIDNSSAFRMEPDVPLVVPEVNPDALAGYRKRGSIANPNCSTIQLVTALKPLHDLSPIKRVGGATYQSTSGGGKAPMDELFNQTRGIFTNQPVQKFQENFTKQIAFNVIPHIDVFMDDGSTKEEWKIVAETRKILDPDIALTATCVRVPVFIGHAEAVNVEFAGPVGEDAARKALKAAAAVRATALRHVSDEGYVTPAECAGEDPGFVSRIRKDPTVEHGINMWVVADNLRKGAALNTVQIAEALIKTYMKKAA